MTQISQVKIDANRRNAQKSTGPRSAEGKERARLNAVKHGLTARLPVLPGEDPALFQERIDGYKADLQPRSMLENHLVERMAQESWQTDRALFADAARLAAGVRTAAAETAEREKEESVVLGQRLFFDRRGPLSLYGCRSRRPVPRTSWSDIPDDPDDPTRLVMRLESTGAGCRWLLDRWGELRARLEAGQSWQSSEKLKAIRLLGRQPLDAADERDVTELFLACHMLDPEHKDAFFELRCEMDDDEYLDYLGRLAGRPLAAMRPEDATAARALLLGLIEKATGRLNALAAVHHQHAGALAALNADRMAFDSTPVGERLRRYKTSCDRTFHRALAAFLKIRKEVEIPECDTTDQEDAGQAPAFAGADEFRNEPTVVEENDFQNEPTDAVENDFRNEPTGVGENEFPNESAGVAENEFRNEPTITRAQLVAAREAVARQIERLEARQKARRGSSARAGKHRGNCKELNAAPPQIGYPRSAGGNPRHRRDRKNRNKMAELSEREQLNFLTQRGSFYSACMNLRNHS